MADLIFSKQIKERQKFFPWLKIFQRKLLKKFPNDLDFDILQFLLQNLSNEITSLPRSGKTKRKEALFETMYNLFLHFWWRIHWKGRKKWSRYWKNVSSDISYAKDESSKCCEKLLYYIIHLGITLSQGHLDSEWIQKVFQAIHILPSFDPMVYSSLLQVKKLPTKYHPSYIAILKHVLCTEVLMSITEPAEYIKIMLLFRRLKRFTSDGYAISAIKSTASRIKPPSNLIQWMSSQAIDFPLQEHENIVEEFLKKKSSDWFRKLYHIVTAPVDSEQKIHTQLCQSERVEPLNNKTEVKKFKRKKSSHSKLKLKDSLMNLCVDGTSVCLSPSRDSEASTGSKYKMDTNTTIIKNSKKHTNLKKKTCSKSQDLFDKKFNKSSKMVGATAMNEFLNFSFAEISNFSRRVVSQKQNIQHAPKENSGIESNILKKGTIPNESLAITNINSNSNEEQEKSFDGPSSHKKKKLDLNEKCHLKSQSTQKLNPQEPIKTTCLNSLVTLSSNKLKSPPLNTEILTNECTSKTADVDSQSDNSSQNLIPDHQCISNENLFDTKTSEIHKKSSQTQTKQTSPGKSKFISSIDIHKTHPSALLKLVQVPNEDSVSRLCEASANALYEDTNSNQIHANTDNLSKGLASGSFSIIQAPQKLKVFSDVPPNINPAYSNATQIDTDSNKTIASTDSIGGMHFSKNVNENLCRNDEINFKYPSSGNSSVDLSNSLTHSASWVGNKSNINSSLFLRGVFDDHKWGESQPLFSTISRSLEPTQNCLTNNMKNSCVNSEATRENSFVTPTTENRFGNISVSQSDIPPNCVVDCSIVNDYDPDKIQHENITTFKLVINVTCKTPEDTPNQQSEHIFGNFSNASENYFDSSLSLFPTANPTPEMPKLTPFYDDPPIQTAAVDVIATPPDSELEINVPNFSSKQGEAETLMKSCFEKPQNKPNYTSTPKDVQNTFPRKFSKDSNFRTPQTSDCETSSECNLNLTNSLVTHTSTMKAPVDDILERLNYKIHLPPDKSELHNANTAQNFSKENISNRCLTDIYSYEEELSEDSTISTVSRLSTTDDELNTSSTGQKVSTLRDTSYSLPKSILTDESNLKTLDISKQRSLKVFQKRRKNAQSKKFSESGQTILKDFQEKSTCGYNLRPRRKLNRPSSLEDFF